MYIRGYELPVQMVKAPSGHPPNLRGNPTPIPSVLGVSGGACNLVFTVVHTRCHLQPTNHDTPRRTPGMEQVGVLDGDYLGFLATRG